MTLGGRDWHKIHFVPKDAHTPVIGEAYASSRNGLGSPVITEPLGPEAQIRWALITMGEGVFQIAASNNTGFWQHQGQAPVGEIYLEPQGSGNGANFKWMIVKDASGADIYNIRVNTDIIGETWYVDERDGKLVINPVPVFPPGAYAPRWHIVKVEN